MINSRFFIPRLAIIFLILTGELVCATAALRRMLPLSATISGAVLSTGLFSTHRTAEPSEKEKCPPKVHWHSLTSHQEDKIIPRMSEKPATITLTADKIKSTVPARYKDFLDNSNLVTLLANKELTPRDLVRIFDHELTTCYLVKIAQLYPHITGDLHSIYNMQNRIFLIKRLATAGHNKLFIQQLDDAIIKYYRLEEDSYPLSAR